MPISLGFWILLPPFASSRYVTCPRCVSSVPMAFNYCSFCGYMLHPERLWSYATIICSNCKNRIQMSAQFCPECGHKQ